MCSCPHIVRWQIKTPWASCMLECVVMKWHCSFTEAHRTSKLCIYKEVVLYYSQTLDFITIFNLFYSSTSDLSIHPSNWAFNMTSVLYCKFHFHDRIPRFTLHYRNHTALSYKWDTPAQRDGVLEYRQTCSINFLPFP